MPVVRAVLLSLLVHFIIILIMIFFVPQEDTHKTETAEVELINTPPPPKAPEKKTKPQQQFVRDAFVPDKLKAPEDETLARFMSEHKQRVRKESQAAMSGMTQNSSPSAAQKAQKQQQANQAQQQKPPPQQVAQNTPPEPPEQATDKDGYRNVDISQQLAEMNQLSHGESTVGESLPKDVSVGSFTALNTDRYLYYTFYARIEELVRYRWETRVQTAINSFEPLLAQSAAGRPWITNAEFLLNRKGELVAAHVLQESGMKKFDAAAIEAFKDARVFPNPPQEMVQDDGYIHLNFGFEVNYSHGDGRRR